MNRNMYILWNQTWDISWKMIYTGHFFSPLTMMMMPSYTLLCFQLMRQIDLMVSAKKAEWETHVHAVQIQLDKKTKEVEFVKVQLEQKCQEVSVLYWLFSSFIKILHLWWGCKQKAYNYSTERKKESFVHLKIHNVFMIFSNFCWRWSECCWIISNKRLKGLFNKEPEANTGNCFFYNCSDSWVLSIFFVNSNSVVNSFCCYMHVISSNSSFKNFL